VGFSPTSPQNAAGIRIEPPVSVAVARGTMPAAIAAPEPPLEPPGEYAGAQGFRVAPNGRFAVKPSQANSGVFAFPTGIAPAARSAWGIRPSRSAGGVGEQQRSVGGRQARQVLDVLHEERDARQGARVLAPGDALVQGRGLGEGLLRAERDHRAHPEVEPFDPADRLEGELPGGGAAGADGAGDPLEHGLYDTASRLAQEVPR